MRPAMQQRNAHVGLLPKEPTTEELLLGDIKRLWRENMSRTVDEWTPLIDAMATLRGVTSDHIKKTYAAFVDTEHASKLVATNEKTWLMIKTAYQVHIKPGMTVFDFERKQIIQGTNKAKGLTEINNYLVQISGVSSNLHEPNSKSSLLEDWRVNPSIEHFESIARKFNVVANIINQKYGLQNTDYAIPPAIEPKPREKRPKSNFMLGLGICPITADRPYDIPNGWGDRFEQLVDDAARRGEIPNLEEVRVTDADLYANITRFHRDEMLVLHHSEKKKPCMWYRSKLSYLAGVFLERLRSRPGRYRISDDTKLEEFSFDIPGKNFKGKHFYLYSPKINDIFITCPCVLDGPNGKQECGTCFNLSQDRVILGLRNIFEQIREDQNVKDLFKLIDTMNKVRNVVCTYRIKSNCPECGYVNFSAGAIENNDGYNPKLKHPTDVQCDSCKYNYCTDCKESHPGRICRGYGFNPEPGVDPGPNIQACPGCRIPTNRYDGCTCIVCENPSCAKIWCWNCRCFRHDEATRFRPDPKIHDCMIGPTHFTTNPEWVNNPEFVAYTTQLEEHAPTPNEVLGGDVH